MIPELLKKWPESFSKFIENNTEIELTKWIELLNEGLELLDYKDKGGYNEIKEWEEACDNYGFKIKTAQEDLSELQALLGQILDPLTNTKRDKQPIQKK